MQVLPYSSARTLSVKHSFPCYTNKSFRTPNKHIPLLFSGGFVPLLDPFVERKYSQSRFLIIALWSTVHISKGIGSFTTLNDKVKIDVSYHFK